MDVQLSFRCPISADVVALRRKMSCSEPGVDRNSKYAGRGRCRVQRTRYSIFLVSVLVVDNIDHAIAIGKKYRHSLRMVTIEGESLSPGGSMTGGAFQNNSNLLGSRT